MKKQVAIITSIIFAVLFAVLSFAQYVEAQEQSANVKNWLTVVDKVNECGRYLRQYEAGKMALANGDEVDIPAEKLTALKQAFAQARTEGIAAWNAITAQ